MITNPARISYNEDSAWCQEHGHTGLLVAHEGLSTGCELCEELVATYPAIAALVGTVHNPDGSQGPVPTLGRTHE